MKKYYIILALFSLINGNWNKVLGQDFTFSQFYEMPLLRNPALAGIFDGHLRVQTAYRSQWSSITVPFNSKAISLEYRRKVSYSSPDFMTFGLQVTKDEAGDSKFGRTQVMPVFNFHKLINDEYSSFLSVAFMGGFVQNQFDPSGLTFDDQFQNGLYNPLNQTRQIFSKTNTMHFDGGAGLSFSSMMNEYAEFYLGLSGYHLFSSNTSLFLNSGGATIKPRYVANGGLSINSSGIDNAIFYGDYVMQGGNRQFIAGFLYNHSFITSYDEESVNKKGIYIGGSYRWADALIPTVKLEMNKFFIGASYDINISKLTPVSRMQGGLEVTASYKTYFNQQLTNEIDGYDASGRRRERDAVRCSRFSAF